jgi:hypothetical protein
MKFNQDYLETYATLLKTTNLQKGYQEFIKLFRYLRIELEKEFSSYSFSGNIVENGMDYSYFQFTNEELKAKGLKIVIAFVHSNVSFEVWLSGYNRKCQCDYYEKLKSEKLKFILNHQPSRIDYIMKLPINNIVDLSDSMGLLHVMKENIAIFLEYIQSIG